MGGIGAAYSNADWIRAMRYGVMPDERSVKLMPAYETYFMSDADLGDLIAYLKSVAPVDRPSSESSFGPILGADPNWPPAANLTMHPTGLSDWTEEDFVRAIREGVDKDGNQLNEVMRAPLFAAFTDDELRAIWLYLETLPPTPYGTR